MRLRSLLLTALLTVLVAPASYADPRGDAKAQVAFGIEAAQHGLWREATYRFERAVAIDPSYAFAFNNLAVACEQQGLIEKARDAYEKALALAPKSELIHQNYELFKEIHALHLAVTLGSVTVAAALAGCTGLYPVAVATRVPAALNMAPYSRLLVAGFIGGGNEDVDTNGETVRLLRSQLRAARSLTIVNAGAMPLTDTVLGDAAFWRRVGEEYQHPLVVTGRIVLSSQTGTDVQFREREAFDGDGVRRVEATRLVTEVLTRILTARLVHIDGRTGTIIHTDLLREETSYAATQSVPALSSYFELMARVVPVVFGTLSDHQIVGPRTLLK